MPRRRIGQERLKLGADQGRQTGSLDVPEVLLEDEVVISTRTRLATQAALLLVWNLQLTLGLARPQPAR
jgi:hypothetical protein